MYMCVHEQAQATANLWRSEDNSRELGLSFYHIRSGDQRQVSRLDDKHLYPLPISFGPQDKHSPLCFCNTHTVTIFTMHSH